MENKYGCGKHPPYSLYQEQNCKWGLIDGYGNKLQADFKRLDEHSFSCVPWEIVTFDEGEGVQLQSWYDPCEVWFNFTWEDPAYPEEFSGYLWKKPEKAIEEYTDTLFGLMPNDTHWIIKYILKVRQFKQMEDEDLNSYISTMLAERPEMAQPSLLNPMLDSIMRNNRVDQDIKIALWNEKVALDDTILMYKEENPDYHDKKDI